MHSRERFRHAFDDAPIGMALSGRDGVVQRANAALCERLGADPAGRPLADLVDADDLGGRPFPADGGEIELRYADAGAWGLWHHSLLTGRDGHPEAWISHCIDVSKRRIAEDELSWQANHDSLTGLPNRELFLERLSGSLGSEGRVAVLLVDLDDFKVVNDSLGHGAGDRLLSGVAERLCRVLRPSDVIARFGGDEFTVLLPGITSEGYALAVARRLAEALREPLVLDGERRYVTRQRRHELQRAQRARSPCAPARRRRGDVPRQGDWASRAARSSTTPCASARWSAWSSRAGCAMHSTTASCASSTSRWSRSTTAASAASRRCCAGTTRSSASSRRCASSRWPSATGSSSPSARGSCARRAGSWPPGATTRSACRSTSRPASSARPTSSTSSSAALEDSGIEPGRLCLEITETAMMADPGAIGETLSALKALGVRLAVDDFGVGHASLRQLRALLPVDTLKIDKSFVDGITDDADDAAIVEGVVRLAHSLGLQAVAEGVETAEQVAMLRCFSCQTGQGYHFARPAGPEAIARMLTAAPAARRRAA